MSRTLHASLLSHIAGEVLTLALCVRLERRDGTVMGFTSHDRNLTFASVTYLATSAVEASQVRNTLGASLDNMEVFGLLQSSVIDDDDLIAGLYDGAKVEVFLVNWTDSPITNRIGPIHKGTIGDLSMTDGRWDAEFRPLSARLTHQIGDLTSPTCRAQSFGSPPCAPGGLFANGAALSFYQRTGKLVTVVTDRYQVTLGSVTDATDFFSYGLVAFTSGNNAGISREIKRHVLSGGAAQITLQEPFPRTVVVGDAATLTAGCDRRIESCRVYVNAINFQGEPLIPGTDQALVRGRRGG